MSRMRARLIREFGEDEQERWEAIYDAIKETSPREALAMWLIVYRRIMRGDAIKDISRDFMYTPNRIPAYFRRLIEKKNRNPCAEPPSLRKELMEEFKDDTDDVRRWLQLDNHRYGWMFWLSAYHRIMNDEDVTQIGRECSIGPWVILRYFRVLMSKKRKATDQ